MKFPRRRFLHLATGAAALLAAPHIAKGQAYPARPVTMVVPFGAGGASDVSARIIASGLAEALKQSVVVENVPAVGGTVGTARVARATPDGYQFVLGSLGTHTFSQLMHTKPPYNAATDFAPVALLVEQALMLVSRPNFPADTLLEFISYAKSNQAKMQYGSPGGVGSANHLACARLNAAIGVDVTHVPYRGAGPAYQDLTAGRIDYACPILTSSIVPQVESKQVKAIAVFAKERVTFLPHLATAHEQGLASSEASNWQAVFLPKGTPAPIVEKLHNALVATIDNPLVRARLMQAGSTIIAPERRSPEYLARFVLGEIETWGRVVKAAGIKPI